MNIKDMHKQPLFKEMMRQQTMHQYVVNARVLLVTLVCILLLGIF
jgi:hypothetical protein